MPRTDLSLPGPLAAIHAHIVAACQQNGGAMEIADQAVLEIAAHLGGQSLYIPLAAAIRTRLRNSKIYRDYTAGIAVADLAKHHQMSCANIYRIISEYEPV